MIINVRASSSVDFGKYLTDREQSAFTIIEGNAQRIDSIAEAMLPANPKKNISHYSYVLSFKEKNLTKEEIISLYLNQIFLGNRSYGVEAAARNYFKKNIEQLTLAEIALLAGLPSAPAHYSPINDMKLARERQSFVLNRMQEEGYISEREKNEALNSTIVIFKAGTDKDFNMQYAPYFTEYVRQTVIEKYVEDFLYEKGLTIYTTAHLKAIQAAQQALQAGLRSISKQRGFKDIIEHIDPEQIPTYIQKVHDDIMEEVGILYFPSNRASDLTTTILKDHRLYKAVITQAEGLNLQVQVGLQKGLILRQDRNWIWKKLIPGDVIWVKRKITSTAEAKSGIYSPQNTYFVADKIPEIEGALYAMEPQTGKIVAMIGGYDFQRSEFNRTIQAHRQPGSSFKPIVYAAALDKGYSPRTKIIDSPVTFQVGDNEYWTPKNYGGRYRGNLLLKDALTHSINIVAVKVLHDIGLDYLLAYAHKLGLQSEIHPYLSSALGASDTTLKEMTEAYAVFAANGKRNPSYSIRMITDQSGNIIEQAPQYNPMASAEEADKTIPAVSTPKDDNDMNQALLEAGLAFGKEKNLTLANEELKILYGARIPPGYVITPQTAYLMTALLKNVVQYGTGYRARELNRPAAGKTGTTKDETDALFIGYTPQLITGVWVGFDELKKIGKGMTGGGVKAPIWLGFMKAALEGQP